METAIDQLADHILAQAARFESVTLPALKAQRADHLLILTAWSPVRLAFWSVRYIRD